MINQLKTRKLAPAFHKPLKCQCHLCFSVSFHLYSDAREREREKKSNACILIISANWEVEKLFWITDADDCIEGHLKQI